MQLPVKIDTQYMRTLECKLNWLYKPHAILREALTIFVWAVDEARKGRIIISVHPDGTRPQRLAMDVLERVREQQD